MTGRTGVFLRLGLLAVFPALFLAVCAGSPERRYEREVDTAEAAGQERVYNLTDYKTRAEGGFFPVWIEYYLEENIAGLEALEEYQDRYVFIARGKGTNFRALEQWAEGFSVELDFARLAAIRMERRFTRAAAGFPDTVFGRYFEAIIRAASDASWEGAVREDDFWLKGYYEGTGENADSDESYDFMILVTIDKTFLVSQIQALFSGVTPQSPMSGDQLAAVGRIRERFFEGF
jgi:hypothetical protein